LKTLTTGFLTTPPRPSEKVEVTATPQSKTSVNVEKIQTVNTPTAEDMKNILQIPKTIDEDKEVKDKYNATL
jgi:hypothetical protein